MNKFEIILADPPWFYNNRKTGGERNNKSRFGGGAMKHYPLMRDRDLIGMADFVQSITADNALLFMWATMPRLDFATDLVKAWGFKYATVWMTWIKTSRHAGFTFHGLGNGLVYGPGGYTASNAEVVLLGRKGKAIPQAKAMTPSLFFAPRQERHSQKPPHVHERLDLLYPDRSKIELFARRPYPGWTAWGNEIDEGRALAMNV